jgi:hypothetical protein
MIGHDDVDAAAILAVVVHDEARCSQAERFLNSTSVSVEVLDSHGPANEISVRQSVAKSITRYCSSQPLRLLPQETR